jgi:hypothetical protein
LPLPEKRPYKKFPGIWTLLAKDTLWIASDHLLYVILWFITEDYKRFYFRDIQAVVLYKTRIWKVLNLLLPVTTALLILAAATSTEAWGFFFYFAAGVTLCFCLGNLLLGPTCECYIQTAGQNVKLTPLTRVRKAQKVMDYLTPLVKAAQATDE